MNHALGSSLAGIATFGAWNVDEDAQPTLDLGGQRLGQIGSTFSVASSIPGFGGKRLQGFAKDVGAEIVLCHYANLALHFRQVWTELDIPLMVHCHGYDITFGKRRASRIALSQTRGGRYKKALVELSDRSLLIANSEFTADRLKKHGVKEHRIRVKHLGVPRPPDSLTSQAKPIGGEVSILFLGRLVECKGPTLTIKAFGQALKTGLNARLTVAGDGPMLRDCQKLVHEFGISDRVRFLGFVSRKHGDQLRASADIFTIHNRIGPTSKQEEAYGVAIVEAMAAGLPVVGTNTGGPAETVVHNQTGFLVEPYDLAAHARALIRLALDPALRAKMGRQARIRAASVFSLEAEAQRLQDIIAAELEQPASGPINIQSRETVVEHEGRSTGVHT